MFSKIFCLFVVFSLYQYEAQAQTPADTLQMFVAGVAQLDDTIKVEFPKMITTAIESIQTMESQISIDEENVELRIRQAVGNKNSCIEKHREDIKKYVNAVATAYKTCAETNVKLLKSLREDGNANLLRPSAELRKEMEQATEKCLKEINSKPNCPNDIMLSSNSRFAEIQNKANDYITKATNLNLKGVSCLQDESTKSIQELEVLSNKVKICGK